MTDPDVQWLAIGGRIRAARAVARLSVREFARRIGVSASHVSQVERGIGAFSVPVLYAVARELGVPMHDLLEPAVPVHPAGARDDDDPIVQRAEAHPTVQLSSGPRWRRLTPSAEPDVEFLEVTYAPAVQVPERRIRHEGREYGLVISGALTVEVDDEITVLGPGDSIAFDSMRPHRFWNEAEADARAVWFVRDRDAKDAAPHG